MGVTDSRFICAYQASQRIHTVYKGSPDTNTHHDLRYLDGMNFVQGSASSIEKPILPYWCTRPASSVSVDVGRSEDHGRGAC